MQDVQTWMRRGLPSTSALTRWMLGFQRRLVRRWEWLMLIPKEGCLPHTSHTAAMGRAPSGGRSSGPVEATRAGTLAGHADPRPTRRRRAARRGHRLPGRLAVAPG